MKPTIVLADAEKRNVRVLGVALRNEGYTVRVAANGVEALEKIEATSPAVVVSDSRLPKIDGYSLARTLKERSETAHIPVVLLTNRSESPNQGREGDVAEFLPKPVFVREFVACVGLLVARGARARMAAEAGGSGRFSGSTKDIPVVDLLQTFEVLRESGVLQLARGSQEGEIFFREGRAVDAKLGRLRGERAVYALFVWSDAMFDIEFKPVSREDVLDRSIGTIVMEGMRRVDEWGAICEQLRPLTTILDVNDGRFIEQVVARLYDSTEPSWSAGETRLLSSAAHSVIADALQSSRTPRLQVDADVEDATDEPHDDAVPEAPLQRTPAMARTSHGGGLASSPPKSIAAPDDPSRIPQAGSEVDVATTPDADAVAPAPQKRLGASEVARNLAPAVATTPHVNGLASAHPKTLPAPEETAVATTPHVNGLASA
ncbi:MAG: DUF4388 domain-containing protein, partial [Polyangiaceae bacterium]